MAFSLRWIVCRCMDLAISLPCKDLESPNWLGFLTKSEMGKSHSLLLEAEKCYSFARIWWSLKFEVGF